MPTSGELLKEGVSVNSETFPLDELCEILTTPGMHLPDGHFQYPVSDGNRIGNHLDSLFIIEPIAGNTRFIGYIVADMYCWIAHEKLKFDVIFAPAQPAVKPMVRRLAERLRVREAYWDWLPTGWFGDRLLSGEIKPGDRVLVFNGVSQQGRCVGERLPSFVKDLGGDPIAAAVFAIGTGPGAQKAKELYGSKLYASVQVDINVHAPDQCPICARPDAPPLVRWTDLHEAT